MIDDEIYDVDAQSKTASIYLHEHGLFTESRLIDALLREKEKLLDQLESAQKDAARYQWRKENSQVRIGQFQNKYRAETQNSVLTDWFDSHDEAIDAAMRSTN